MSAALPLEVASKPAAGAGPRPWTYVFGTLFVCAWAGNQFSPMLLLYKDVEHYSSSMVTLFLGIYVAGLAPALVISGAVADQVGRRAPMSAAVWFGLAASVLLALGEWGATTICVGRLLAGMAVGTAMAVGSSWLKELSQKPYDTGADAGSGARRASLAFTLGSALGALVAGSFAQWGPLPEVLPYFVHIGVTLPCLWLVRRPPETLVGGAEVHGLRAGLRAGLRVRSVRHPRFARVVMIYCPWLFVACALAYGYLPVLLADATGGLGLAYATLLSVVALIAGSLIQPVAKRIDTASSARGIVVAMAILILGLVLMIVAVEFENPAVGVVSSVVFGAGFGTGLVSGLLEVQRLAPPTELAKATGVFYAIAYLGFALPTLLAALTPPLTTMALLVVVGVLMAASTAAVSRASRRYLPAERCESACRERSVVGGPDR